MKEIPKGSLSLIQGCVFCGEMSRSKEHFWPSWIRETWSEPERNNHIDNVNDISCLFNEDWKNEIITNLSVSRLIPGTPINKRFKIVCKSCNGGWMNVIENDAKPILLSLINDQSTTLSENDQKLLSNWVFIKTIVGSYRNRQSTHINYEDVRFFYETRQLPANWLVGLGRLKEYQNIVSHYQINGEIGFQTKGPNPSPVRHLSKTATFTLENLVLLSVNFLFPAVDPLGTNLEFKMVDDLSGKLFLLNQGRSIIFNWNYEDLLSKEDLYNIKNNLAKLLSMILHLSKLNETRATLPPE